MKYKWTDGASHRGIENTYNNAFNELQKYVDWNLLKCWAYPTAEATYFYKTEQDMEADKDGAYTPSITHFSPFN